MEDDLNGRRPEWKTTSMEDDLNRRLNQWKTTSMEDNLNILMSNILMSNMTRFKCLKLLDYNV